LEKIRKELIGLKGLGRGYITKQQEVGQ